jgi:Fe-S cluster assembly protein SufD
MKIDTTINPLPVLTWNWLKINSAPFSIDFSPDGDGSPSVTGVSDGIIYEKNGRKTAAQLPVLTTGTGKNSDILFEQAVPAAFIARKNVQAQQPVLMRFDLKDGSTTASLQIIHAEENAHITVIIVSSSDKNAAGFQALRTLCHAEKNAYIHLVKVQLLGSGFRQADDTGTTSAEGGRVEVTQIILGGTDTYTGVYAALPSYLSSFKSDTAYLCSGSQKLDMNYVALHTGKKTDCKMHVKGTLRNNAQKTYRGSIDFRTGCSGSTGNEQEETLLLSPTVINKSIPLILCNEEDVAGEHGASIGRLGEDVLFYMQSRGISKSAAEEITARAKVAGIAALIPDDNTLQRINAYLDEAFNHE